MKAVVAVLAPIILLVAPAGASADVLHDTLAAKARQQMSVAPWVGVKVTEVKVADKISWIAQTAGGQVYACAAHADADALLSADGAVCVRAGAAARSAEARRIDANARNAQARRMNVTVGTWSGPDSRGVVYGTGTVTLTALGS